MAFFTKSEARNAFRAASVSKTADQFLRESLASPLNTGFDVFLSHSYEDKELMLGVKLLLEREGAKVYLDWMTDGHLDRSRVTAETANLLRTRMKQSKSLIFAATTNSPSSKWMPWELGYFDGAKPGHVSIIPLVDPGQVFVGQEYLSLYPVVEKKLTNLGVERPVVTRQDGDIALGRFMKGDLSSRPNAY
jgi:hypothetical protein